MTTYLAVGVILGYGLLLAWMAVGFLRKWDRFATLPLFAVVALESVWHVPPAVQSLFETSPEAQAFTVTGTGVDLLFTLMWVAGFLIVRRAWGRVGTRMEGGRAKLFADHVVGILRRLDSFLVMSIITLFLYYPVAAALGWPIGYAERDYFHDTSYTIRFSLLYAAFMEVRGFAAPVACVAMMLRGTAILDKRNALALGVVLLSSVVGLGGGPRAAAATPIVFLVLTSLVLRRSVKQVAILAGGFVLVMVLAFTSISVARATLGDRGSLVERLQHLLTPQGGSEPNDTSVVVERLNKAYYTGVIVETVAREGTVGLKPYYAVPFALVPRAFWPGKPLIGSADGTEYQLLPYLASFWAHGWYGNSVSVGAGGMGYWMGGFLGVVLLGLASGLFVAFLWSGPVGLFRYPFWVAVFFTTMAADPSIAGGWGGWINEITTRAFMLSLLMLPFWLGIPKGSGPALVDAQDKPEGFVPRLN
jgi:hypothetical protein